MRYLVLGYDGNDQQAQERRMAVREQHVQLGSQLRKEGKVLLGVAMLDDSKQMIGSVYIVDFETREELDQWLAIEPYVTGKVWQRIEIKQCQIPASFSNIDFNP